MCDDEHGLIIHAARHLKGTERLSETHLGVPQTFEAFLGLEVLHRLRDGFLLFGPEADGAWPHMVVGAVEGKVSFFLCPDGPPYPVKVGTEPDVGILCACHGLVFGECHSLDTGIDEHIVDILRRVAFVVIGGRFHKLQVVDDALHVRTPIKNFPDRL